MLVATYNVHRGRGAGGRFRPHRILEVVAEIRPDLIALQEAQHYLRRGVPMLDGDTISAGLGLRPLSVAEEPGQQGWRSNVVLVRQDAAVLAGPFGLRLGGLEPRGGIHAVLDLGWGPFRMVAAHLSLGAATRRRQAEAMLQALARGPGQHLPALLLGDLNEWRAHAGALAVLAPLFGTPPPAPTFPAFRPIASLDRILGHPRGLVPRVAVHDTPLARRASDHLPLTARIETGLLGGAAS